MTWKMELTVSGQGSIESKLFQIVKSQVDGFVTERSHKRDWVIKCQLQFSIDKYRVMHMGGKCP